jgi:hypothetical protein
MVIGVNSEAVRSFSINIARINRGFDRTRERIDERSGEGESMLMDKISSIPLNLCGLMKHIHAHM